jgi:hypothetical protein
MSYRERWENPEPRWPMVIYARRTVGGDPFWCVVWGSPVHVSPHEHWLPENYFYADSPEGRVYSNLWVLFESCYPREWGDVNLGTSEFFTFEFPFEFYGKTPEDPHYAVTVRREVRDVESPP